MNKPDAYLVESIPPDLADLRPPEGVAETKTALKRLVDEAQETIDVTAVYWSLLGDGEDMTGLPAERLAELGAGYGRALFEALENAAQRGVNIRILEATGFGESEEEPKPLESARLAEQFPDRVQIRSVDLQPWFGGGIMHHKSWIVDGRSLYLGSANMDWRSLTQVKELGVIIENQPAVAADATRQFEAWWQFAALEPQTAAIMDAAAQKARLVPHWSDLVVGNGRSPHPFAATGYNQANPLPLTADGTPETAYLTASPPELGSNGRTDDLTGLLHTIHTARSSLCLSVMNFIPAGWLDEQMFHWPALTDALLHAAISRGVHVRLLISHWPYTFPGTWPFLQALRDWAAAGQENGNEGGIEIKRMMLPGWDETEGETRRFAGHSRVNHPKFIVSERRLNVGTSNMMWGYFSQTIGGSFNTDHPALVQQAQAVFDRDWQSPYAQMLD
jgi:phospholipase D3/4